MHRITIAARTGVQANVNSFFGSEATKNPAYDLARYLVGLNALLIRTG